MKLPLNLLAVACLAVPGFCAGATGEARDALARQAQLTPENLIRSFAEFAFELRAERQDAETFLQRKSGDCDDFASLASRLLADRGYKTKLVAVMMEQQTHVVCYVEEAQGYLDFNHRADAQPIIKSDGSLEDIAHQVARDFRSRWLTASEFRYENELPLHLEMVFAPATVTLAPRPERQGTNGIAFRSPRASMPIPTSKIAERQLPDASRLGSNLPVAGLDFGVK